VKTTLSQQLVRRQRSLSKRLASLGTGSGPALGSRTIHVELSEKARGLTHGGLGPLHSFVQRLGLPERINSQVSLLQVHRGYHESDHVLNIAYNALCEGDCLQDIERRQHDEVHLDLLGTQRLPDPTTAGDFCRRFTVESLLDLEEVFHQTRQQVWRRQPPDFFTQAKLDVDGTMVSTTGSCKEGMDISYDGTWGYHPLVITLANTGEVMTVINRSGNRPSHEGAAAALDRSIKTCLEGGFRSVLLRGDTDFSQTQHLDRWYEDGRIQFIFGFDASPKLVDLAENLQESAWQPLLRPTRSVKTTPRQKPVDVKQEIVRQRQFKTLRLQSEDVAEFLYQPTACKDAYRLVVVRKNISQEQGEQRLFDEIRYFFYITNILEKMTPEEVVFEANDRCDQEKLIAQLKSGCHALTAPSNSLLSNQAYMLMTSLAWNLKAWWALSLPEQDAKSRQEKKMVLRWSFKSFVQSLVRIPCQLVRSGRQLLLRVLNYTPHTSLFFRLCALRC
jgi:Transposase DDE domain group 1